MYCIRTSTRFDSRHQVGSSESKVTARTVVETTHGLNRSATDTPYRGVTGVQAAAVAAAYAPFVNDARAQFTITAFETIRVYAFEPRSYRRENYDSNPLYTRPSTIPNHPKTNHPIHPEQLNTHADSYRFHFSTNSNLHMVKHNLNDQLLMQMHNLLNYFSCLFLTKFEDSNLKSLS